MSRNSTDIRIDEHGDETHESWLRVRANHISGTPGARLFDSEIPHSRWVRVTVARCTRQRDLNRDWLYNTNVLMEFDMSQAQWGAFVSSFGDGGGVPATLTFLAGEGDVPAAPAESRFDESHREVLNASTEALASIKRGYDALQKAFETGGKREQRAALGDLGIRLGNAPKNMAFAAKSLTEHVENVVTKARADIEGMVLAAMERGELSEGVTLRPLLGRSGPVEAERTPTEEDARA